MRVRSSLMATTLWASRGRSSSTSLRRFRYSDAVRHAAGMASRTATAQSRRPCRSVQATVRRVSDRGSRSDGEAKWGATITDDARACGDCRHPAAGCTHLVVGSGPPMRFVPDRSGFRELARHGRLAFVYKEVVADADTPVSAYAKLGRGPYSFLLESVVGGEKWAAYSFVGVRPRAVVRARGEDVEILTPVDARSSDFVVTERVKAREPVRFLDE